MKKPINNYKITPDIRKQIEHLVESLPKVPFLIRKANGESSLQMTKTTNMITGSELKQAYAEMGKKQESIPLFLGENTQYSYQQEKMRLINHKVELTTRFQREGQFGIDQYVEYITTLHSIIQNAGKPKDGSVKINEENNSGTPTITMEPASNLDKKPTPDDFITVDGYDWDAFHAAESKWLENSETNVRFEELKQEPSIELLTREDFTSDKAYDDYLFNVDENHIPSDLEYPESEDNEENLNQNTFGDGGTN